MVFIHQQYTLRKFIISFPSTTVEIFANMLESNINNSLKKKLLGSTTRVYIEREVILKNQKFNVFVNYNF